MICLRKLHDSGANCSDLAKGLKHLQDGIFGHCMKNDTPVFIFPQIKKKIDETLGPYLPKNVKYHIRGFRSHSQIQAAPSKKY